MLILQVYVLRHGVMTDSALPVRACGAGNMPSTLLWHAQTFPAVFTCLARKKKKKYSKELQAALCEHTSKGMKRLYV